MSEWLNLRLKDGIEPSVLLKYGFVPKYDENTGEIYKYIHKIHIEGKHPDEKHFTFVYLVTDIKKGLFRRRFMYEAWMSAFRWNGLCKKEALQVFYDLIKDGIVEPAEEVWKE